MKKLRRLRAVFVVGALWAVAGAAIGAIGGLIASVFGGDPLLRALGELVPGAAGLGFVLGSGFAAVLTVIEGRRTLEELTQGRAAVWGATAGATLAFVMLLVAFGPDVGTILSLRDFLLGLLVGSGVSGAMSAALAVGTVALARRGSDELAAGPAPDEKGLLDAPSDG